MTNESIYYVYAYIRSKDSTTAKAGTPYYIGKGTRSRAWNKNHSVSLPTDDFIIILENNLSNLGALAIERRLISWWGRIDNGTGILRNLTDGGDGNRGVVVKESTRLKLRLNALGKVCAKNSTTGKSVGRISTSDPKYLDGTYIASSIGSIRKFRWGRKPSHLKDSTYVLINGIPTLMNLNDPEYLSKKYKSTSAGVVQVRVDNKILTVKIDDPKYTSGEFKHMNVGYFTGKNSTGENEWVKVDDPRIKTGEIVHHGRGMVNLINTETGKTEFIPVDSELRNDPKYVHPLEGKKTNRVVLVNTHTNEKMTYYKDEPHPGKDWIPIMSSKVTVYDKKTENHISISCEEYHTNKDRYSTVSNMKGTTLLKENSTGKLVRVNQSDWRLNSELYETHSATTGKTVVFDPVTNSKNVAEDKTNPDVLSFKLVSPHQKYIICKFDGQLYRINPKDSRVSDKTVKFIPTDLKIIKKSKLPIL